MTSRLNSSNRELLSCINARRKLRRYLAEESHQVASCQDSSYLSCSLGPLSLPFSSWMFASRVC